MNEDSTIAQVKGLGNSNVQDTPPPGFGGLAPIIPITQGGSNTEGGLPPLFMQQMTNMIENVINKKFETVGSTGNTPTSRLMFLPPEREKGSNEKEGHMPEVAPAMRARGEAIKKNLTSKLHEIRNEGGFTSYDSSDEDHHVIEPTLGRVNPNVNDLLRKQIADQQKQMAEQQKQMVAMAKELEELRKIQKGSEKVNEFVPHMEAEAENSVGKESKKGKSEMPGAYINENSPFSEEIQLDPLPKNFRTIACEYQGQEDPEEHLMKFESICLLHQYSDGVKCRVFLTTLAGPAQQWFRQLPKSSICSFEDMKRLFLHRFASSKKATRTSLYLMDVKQESNESLKNYMTRFNDIALEIPDIEPKLKTHALVQGLRTGRFFNSLIKKPANSFDELLARAEKYIHLEEAINAKRSERYERQNFTKAMEYQ